LFIFIQKKSRYQRLVTAFDSMRYVTCKPSPSLRAEGNNYPDDNGDGYKYSFGTYGVHTHKSSLKLLG
jgi:hypothetical protein